MNREQVDLGVNDEQVEEGEVSTLQGDHCPFCKVLNEPAAGSVCEHHVGWKWGGVFDLSADLDALREIRGRLFDLLCECDDDPKVQAFIKRETSGDPERQNLCNLAKDDADLISVLTRAAGAEIGEGWQTDGMLGDSGCNSGSSRRPARG